MPVGPALRTQFPLKVIVGNEDVTNYMSDGLTFSNVDPGGYEACSMKFPKDMPQSIRGQYIRIETGLRPVWEGRISQIQRSLGHQTTINGEGYGALFKDNAASMVFVSRDLTRWGQPSYTRQNAIVTGNSQLATTQVAADPTSLAPALVQQIVDSWATPWTPVCEGWFDSGPNNLIAKVYYALSINEAAIGSWSETMYLSSDANATTVEASGNLHGSAPTSAYFTPATAYRFALVQHANGTTGVGTQGAAYNAYWAKLAVYGNHGLTGRGTDPVGFYPSDIAGWVIGQAPGLQVGVVALTDATGYIVPHSAYYTPVALDQMINDMATAAGWHWGVWESLSPVTGNPTPRCDFRPRPPLGQFTAFCRRDACDTLDIREDLTNLFTTAVVNYTDVAGVNGVATVTAANPLLAQAGINSRTVVFQGGTMTPATATLFGQVALALTNSQARVAGTADINSPIDSPSGPIAPWMLKAGVDRIRIADVPSTDAWGAYNDFPISRVECSASSNGLNTSVELGSGGNLVETLQARLTAATTLAAQGG